MQIKNIDKTSIITNNISKITSYRLFWIISFSILTAISAQIAIPVKPVPFTLQTMIVLLAGAFLGAKEGFYSQVIYLGLGSIGLPVFAQIPDGAVGFARLISPTGGYLLAFPVAAFMVGYLIEKRKSYLNIILSMFLGETIIILCGTLFLGLFFLGDFIEAVKLGAAIFSVWTVLKLIAAASIYSGITKTMSKNPKNH
jgi:biotin transport system substrate-specific component